MSKKHKKREKENIALFEKYCSDLDNLVIEKPEKTNPIKKFVFEICSSNDYDSPKHPVAFVFFLLVIIVMFFVIVCSLASFIEQKTTTRQTLKLYVEKVEYIHPNVYLVHYKDDKESENIKFIKLDTHYHVNNINFRLNDYNTIFIKNDIFVGTN